MTEPTLNDTVQAGTVQTDTIQRVTSEPMAKAAAYPLARSAGFVMGLGGLLMSVSVLLFLWWVLTPLITGQGGRELMTALPLYLGLSALGLVPGILLYFIGRNVRKYGPSLGAGLSAIVFGLPLLGLGVAFFYGPYNAAANLWSDSEPYRHGVCYMGYSPNAGVALKITAHSFVQCCALRFDLT